MTPAGLKPGKVPKAGSSTSAKLSNVECLSLEPEYIEHLEQNQNNKLQMMNENAAFDLSTEQLTLGSPKSLQWPTWDSRDIQTTYEEELK